MNTQSFSLHYPWDTTGYKPEVNFTLNVSENAFLLHIETIEQNPRREEHQHLNFVHFDSCVEWFVNFSPKTCDRYFNFEMNANGTLYASFRKDRYEFTLLDIEDVDLLQIEPTILENKWIIDLKVPFTFIKKYIPEFEYQEGMTITSNFYKSGDNTEYPHFGIWNPIDTPEPDFHRPEYFGKIVLD